MCVTKKDCCDGEVVVELEEKANHLGCPSWKNKKKMISENKYVRDKYSFLLELSTILLPLNHNIPEYIYIYISLHTAIL